MARLTEMGVGRRSIAEAALLRLGQLLLGRPTARTFGAQITEMRVRIAMANRAIRAARPAMVRTH